MYRLFVLTLLITAGSLQAASQQAPAYTWLPSYDVRQTVLARVPAPEGYARVTVAPESYAEWLRTLPLKKGCPPVRLYNGGYRLYQHYHCAVIDMDVGKSDLQQCADAIMRLRSEYLFRRGQYRDIAFDYVSGKRVSFVDWLGRQGRSGAPQPDYADLRRYLVEVYGNASTLSLSKELLQETDVHSIQAGDLLIEGGSPGHAMLIVDVAVKPQTGEKIFLLAQSHMPAQEMHLMKNPYQPEISPWFCFEHVEVLDTPDWTFRRKNLMRFPGEEAAPAETLAQSTE